MMQIMKVAIPTTIAEKINLGVITTIQGMGIVFLVLTLLALLVMGISRIFDFYESKKSINLEPAELTTSKSDISSNTIKSNDQMVVEGIDDEETLAAIMAVVAFNTGSNIDSLKFNSIKALD